MFCFPNTGYEVDIEMALQVEDVDIIVGGHSHTFLFTGDNPPSVETPKGEYPTYVNQLSTGRVVPVVQVYCYSKYLGHMEVNFDAKVSLSFRPPLVTNISVGSRTAAASHVAHRSNSLHATGHFGSK